MESLRIPTTLRSMGVSYALISPRERCSTDDLVKFHSVSEARQFFARFGSDGSLVNSLRSMFARAIPSVAMGLPGRMSNNPYDFCNKLADAVYYGQIVLIKSSGAHKGMPLATPRIRLKDAVQAVTQEVKKNVKLTNPRWEHSDEQKKKDRPDFALAGDELKLMVDVTGVPDGTMIRFYVHDFSVSPAEQITDKTGKTESKTATYLWKATVPHDSTAEKGIEFCGTYLDQSSDQCPIRVKPSYNFYFSM